ncbi:MAG TPA: hypothetical protein VGJ29_10260, partial [Vicinamibacterales bacterium]
MSVTVDSREAFTTEIGTVYGPPPTRNAVPGGVMITCAAPRPGEVVVSGVTGGGTGATAAGFVVAAAAGFGIATPTSGGVVVTAGGTGAGG